MKQNDTIFVKNCKTFINRWIKSKQPIFTKKNQYMKKILFLTTCFLLFVSVKDCSAQVDNNGWAPASVDYYNQPRILFAAHITPALGFPYTGIFYGADLNVKVAKILYLNAGFVAPLLDMSIIHNDGGRYSFYGGAELVLRNKKIYDKFDLTTSTTQSGDYTIKKYRDYKVKVNEQTILRLGAEYYMNSRFEANALTTLNGFKNKVTSGLLMPDGQIMDYSSHVNCAFLYLGIGKKSLNYFKIKMSDYQESDKFTSTLTGYFDLFYAPVITLNPITYGIHTYDAGTLLRKMPFGGRLGMEYYNTSGKFLGFYTKLEFGMMPGVGFPVYFKIGIGVSSIFTKMKSQGSILP